MVRPNEARALCGGDNMVASWPYERPSYVASFVYRCRSACMLIVVTCTSVLYCVYVALHCQVSLY